MGKIDFSVGEFDTRVQFYKQEITRTDAGAIVKDFIKTTEALPEFLQRHWMRLSGGNGSGL